MKSVMPGACHRPWTWSRTGRRAPGIAHAAEHISVVGPSGVVEGGAGDLGERQWTAVAGRADVQVVAPRVDRRHQVGADGLEICHPPLDRSEEHTSELQS